MHFLNVLYVTSISKIGRGGAVAALQNWVCRDARLSKHCNGNFQLLMHVWDPLTLTNLLTLYHNNDGGSLYNYRLRRTWIPWMSALLTKKDMKLWSHVGRGCTSSSGCVPEEGNAFSDATHVVSTTIFYLLCSTYSYISAP